MNPFDHQKKIEGIKQIIAVGSGKGGVGKSTVSSNLASLLSDQGYKVGLLDADVYGPSVPSLFGCHDQKPEINESNKIIPLTRYGVKLMSMGFLIEEDQPVIWRGPMLYKAIDQFLNDVLWGELDYLVIDLPPGTGDVVLTLAQKTPIDGAIVVSTPQSLALSEVKKAIMMFKQVGIPVKAIVENMASFTGPDGKPIQLFPQGGLDELAESYGLQNKISLEFNPKVGMTAEAGIPFVKSIKDSNNLKDQLEKLAALFS